MYDRVEKSLNKAKKDVKRSRKERKDFISRLSHEMRTPLNDMVVLNSLLEQSSLNENQRNIVETLKASTNNLVNSVQAISEASGSESRIKQFENVRFELKKTLEGTIDFYVKKEIGDLTFSFNNENGPEKVLGDPVILKQILLLFIESFLKSKSIPEKLKIDFSVSLTTISNNKAYYQFQLISNFKAFLSESNLSNVLDIEERQVSAEALQEDLQLLNIRMGKHILQSLKGNLDVSMENKLTTLTFTLPFFIPDKSKLMKYGSARIPDFHEISSKSKLRLEEANVLLVEDNELNQKILLIGLKNYIKNIDVALNGKEALDKFGTSNYDLILMDIQMQEMDGLTATRKIREIEESTNSHVPIIAVTANALLGDRETCLSAGMDEYISKPFQIEELVEIIKKFIKD
jgi:CheY-like chemotaxis protein